MQTVGNIPMQWLSKVNTQRVLSFQEGQIIAGTVLKFYPNQMAELSVNGMKLAAKLEAPVEAGVSQVFKVVQAAGDSMQFQIVGPSKEKSFKGNLTNQLLHYFGMKETKEAKALASYMIKSAIPIDHQAFHSAVKWLQETGLHSSSFDVVKLALSRQIPLQMSVLNTLQSAVGGDSLGKLMQTLADDLLPFANGNKGSLDTATAYTRLWQSTKIEQMTAVIDQIRRSALHNQQSPAAEILRKAGISTHASPSTLEGNAFMYEHIARLEKSAETPSLTGLERKVLLEAMSQASKAVDFGKSESVLQTIKAIQASLGFDHEVNLLKGGQTSGELNTVKEIVLKMLQEPYPKRILDQAESIVSKLSALKLLSQENGPVQHVLMQIPISQPFLRDDMTLQWSGRKMENGKIDPHYCKIVFYLDLEQLNETVIDVNIQNKIIHIKLWTEQSEIARHASHLYQDSLKQGLEKMGYQFSSLQIAAFDHHQSDLKIPSSQQHPIQHSSYTGVDIKI